MHNNNHNAHIFPPCPYCKKVNHPQNKCWWRPDARCNKCGQLGHIERICKAQQHMGEAKQAENQPQEEELFTATCQANCSSTESWLIDSGCTNHMSNDQEIFREIDTSFVSKVKIGNGDYIEVKGKGTVEIKGDSGLKLISDVLYVPEVNQNLLSVGQLLEKGFKLIFEDMCCVIKDESNDELFIVKMKNKSFALDFIGEENALTKSKSKSKDVIPQSDLLHKIKDQPKSEIGISQDEYKVTTKEKIIKGVSFLPSKDLKETNMMIFKFLRVKRFIEDNILKMHKKFIHWNSSHDYGGGSNCGLQEQQQLVILQETANDEMRI